MSVSHENKDLPPLSLGHIEELTPDFLLNDMIIFANVAIKLAKQRRHKEIVELSECLIKDCDDALDLLYRKTHSAAH